MFPFLHIPDIADVHTRNAKHDPDLSARQSALQRADLPNFVLSKLGILMLNSLSGFIPSFVVHIPDVVCLSAEKEVLRTDTGGIVALVQNKHAFWDRSIMNLPRDSMCALFMLVKTYQAIIKMPFWSCPCPAILRFFDISPKVPLKWFLSKFRRASVRAKVSLGVFKVTGPDKECCSTMFANSRNTCRSWHKCTPSVNFLPALHSTLSVWNQYE